MKLSKFLPKLICISLLSLPAQAQGGANFSDIFVFGDSLSDDGNLFSLAGIPGVPYWEGRFSNGPVWVEQLASELGFEPGETENFAIGGSTTGAVAQQQLPLALFFNVGRFPPEALYVFWAGANDMLGLLNGVGDVQQIISNGMAQTTAAVTTMASAGAHSFLIPNLPDLSRLPRALELLSSARIKAVAAAVRDYNQALALTLGQLATALSLDIMELDVYSLTNAMLDDPKTYMLKKVDQAVIRRDGKLAKNSRDYLFFDDIHPTAVGHRLIMRAALSILGKSIRGDVNGDAIVNRSDLVALRKWYGPCLSPCPTDLNADGTVDHLDGKILLGILMADIEGGGESILVRRHHGSPGSGDPVSSRGSRADPSGPAGESR